MKPSKLYHVELVLDGKTIACTKTPQSRAEIRRNWSRIIGDLSLPLALDAINGTVDLKRSKPVVREA